MSVIINMMYNIYSQIRCERKEDGRNRGKGANGIFYGTLCGQRYNSRWNVLLCSLAWE